MIQGSSTPHVAKRENHQSSNWGVCKNKIKKVPSQHPKCSRNKTEGFKVSLCVCEIIWNLNNIYQILNPNISKPSFLICISSFVEAECCNQVITIHSFFFFVACSGCILFCPNNSDHQAKHRFNIFQPYNPTRFYKLGNLGFYFPQNLSNIQSKHIQTQLFNMYFKDRSRMVQSGNHNP